MTQTEAAPCILSPSKDEVRNISFEKLRMSGEQK